MASWIDVHAIRAGVFSVRALFRVAQRLAPFFAGLIPGGGVGDVMSRRIVVVGGSAAGMSAASVAKRRDPELVVTVFERSGAISYSACGIPYRLGGEVKRPMEDLVVVTPEDALTKGLDVRLKTEVVQVDVQGRTVHWREVESGEKGSESFDEVVFATGSRPRASIPASPEAGVFPLQTLDDGVRLENWLEQRSPDRVVVVGAGFIGVEIAEALVARGLKVTMVNGSLHYLRNMLDGPLGEQVAKRMEQAGVELVTGLRASGWVSHDGKVHGVDPSTRGPEENASGGSPSPGEPKQTNEGDPKAVRKATKQSGRKSAYKRVKKEPSDAPETGTKAPKKSAVKHGGGAKGKKASSRAAKKAAAAQADPSNEAPVLKKEVQAVLVGEQRIPADMVVLATGVRADSRLAKKAGCRVRADGTVKVDAGMRTGVEGVWACGDLVAFEHRVTKKPVFLPLALHANRSGRIVGENLAGGHESFPGVLGTAITRFQDLEVASTGLTGHAAQEAGLDVVVGDTKAMNRAGYMPGAGEIQVRMVAERATGRLVGVQMVGPPGTAMRIDTAAALIWKGASLEEVEAMDLAYNPPFSPVWDPLAIAARLLEKERAPVGL